MNVSALIMAAGSGKRMGSSVKKQFLKLNGREILYITVDTFSKCNMVDSIIIVTGSDEVEHVRELMADIPKPVKIVVGGSERQYSVMNGLKEANGCDIVLIHDGVRPFVSIEHIEECIRTACRDGACVLGVPVKDTVKVCDCDGNIVSTPDRRTLWLAQTPQVFRYDLIMKAYDNAQRDGFLGTDDASVAEKYGFNVRIVKGDYNNIKITTPDDLVTGNAIIAENNRVM